MFFGFNEKTPGITLVISVALAFIFQGIFFVSLSDDVSAQPGPQPGDCRDAVRKNMAGWPIKLPGSLESSRRLYVLGSCYKSYGRYQAAADVFREGLQSDPLLTPYWRINLFHSYLALGQSQPALKILREIMADSPRREILDFLREILTDEILSGYGKTPDQEGLLYLSAFFSRDDPVSEDYPLLLKSHQMMEKSPEKSAKELSAPDLQPRLELMMWETPNDEAEALRWAGILPGLAQQGIIPTGEDYLRRVKNLYGLRLFTIIIKELETVKKPRWEAETGISLGKYYFQSLVRKKAYHKAADRIGRNSVRKKFSLDDRLAGLMAIRIDIRRRHIWKAREKLQKFVKAHPGDEELPGVFLSLARHYENKSDTTTMIDWCRRIIKEFPKHEVVENAYWLPFWNYFKQKKYQKALKWADEAIANTKDFHPDARARFFYWRGRTQKAQGQIGPGDQTFQALKKLWPTSFYGLTSRHFGSKGPQKPRYTTFPNNNNHPLPKLKAVWGDKQIGKGIFLLVVGEENLATPIMGRKMGEPMADEVLSELGELLRYFKRYRLQFRLTANYYFSTLKRQPVTRSLLWQNAFPLAFQEIVVDQTQRSGISPFFVLAVIREESHFHAEAGSKAGAKGLMQLMPATAKMVAKRNRVPYLEKALLEPDVNITLGVLYLKNVLKRFDWNPVHAAAAYNAGPNAVRRWKKKLGHLPMDEFIENIPYDETRAYVKRVISSYLIYQELYQNGKT